MQSYLDFLIEEESVYHHRHHHNRRFKPFLLQKHKKILVPNDDPLL